MEFNTIFAYNSSYIPTVTVVISLYNYKNFIIPCLASVFEQTFEKLEIIIVDDCSSDSSCDVTHEWLRKYSSRFVSTFLLKHKFNMGPSQTRNTGWENANAEYIFILDADDIIYPTCISKLLTALCNSQASFAYCEISQKGKNNQVCNSTLWEDKKLKTGNYIAVTSLIRKDILKKVRGYDVNINLTGWEDYDLWIKIVRLGGYGILVPQILAEYYFHDGSITTEVVVNNLSEILDYLLKKHNDYFSKKHDFAEIPSDEIIFHIDTCIEYLSYIFIKGWALNKNCNNNKIYLGIKEKDKYEYYSVSNMHREDISEKYGMSYAYNGFRCYIDKMNLMNFKVEMKIGLEDNKRVYTKKINNFTLQLPYQNTQTNAFPVSCILMYHRITDSFNDPHNICVSPDIFKQHIKMLNKYYTIITLEDLVKGLKQKKSKCKTICITFDDGYIDNYSNAVPILKEYNTHAIFFITVGRLHANLWIDRLYQIYKQVNDIIDFNINNKGYSFATSENNYYQIFELFKSFPRKIRDPLLNNLEQKYDINREKLNRCKLMSSENIIELSQNELFEIGSHGMTHSRLTSENDLNYEITLAKDVLEMIIKRNIYSFAIPFGNINDFNNEVIEKIIESEYDCCLTTFEEPVLSDNYRMCLPRIAVKNGDSACYLHKKIESYL